MTIGDYHTHTKASDGHTTVEQNIEAAKAAGLMEIAITDHSFTNMVFHMSEDKFSAQQKAIERADKDGLKVLHGVEANLFADGRLDVPDRIIPQLDVLNLGFHRLLQVGCWRGSFVFINGNGWLPKPLREKLVEMNTEAYKSAMETYPIDTLCHLNHRALVNTAEICRLAAQKNIYIELNEKHIETLEDDIGAALDSGVNFILGSDAHRETKIGRFPRVYEFVKRHAIPESRIYGCGDKVPVFKDKSNWKSQ